MKYAILFGGNSYEHEISIVSAITLSKILSEALFIFCDQDRNFFLIQKEKMNAKTFSSLSFKKELKLNLTHNGFVSKKFFSKKLEFDIALNLIHGQDGEDGKIASLLDFFNIKYLGPRLEASVISFNKILTKIYAKSLGVKVLKYEILKENQENLNISFPCIVKPVRLGSSIGINIAKNEQEFAYAKDVGFELDDTLLVEEFKKDVKEYNLAGCMIDNDFVYSAIEEPKKKEMLDFNQKYLDFSSTSKEKANITKDLEEKLKCAFKVLYEPLFKNSLIRCDFFVIDNEVYLNEINPIPGSMANYLFDDFKAVLEKLAKSVKSSKKIAIDYNFLGSIQGQKGKI